MNQFGINVLPNSCYSQEPTLFRKDTEKDLPQCVAFVQLLSGLVGKQPPELPLGYVHLQLKLAECAQKPVFQWRSPNLDITLIQDENFRSIVNGDKVRTENIDEFKRALKDFVLKKQKKEAEKLHGSHFVFVNMEATDQFLAKQVFDAIVRHGIGCALSLNSGGDPSEIRLDLENNILQSDGVIVIYGECNVTWARRQLDLCRKIGSKRELPRKAFAVFDGPPDQKPPLYYSFPELLVLDFRKGFDNVELEKKLTVFIGNLAKESV